jgi:hypothetical protein
VESVRRVAPHLDLAAQDTGSLLVAAGTPEEEARSALAETTGSRSQQVFGRLV